MAKKDKAFSKNSKLRVRKSYYTFTKEYPQGFVRIERSKRRINKKQTRKALLYALCFILVAGLSFFALSVGLHISYSPAQQEQQKPGDYGTDEMLLQQGIKALYVPCERLGDEAYLREAVRQVRRKNCNSVVIDFKTAEGKLCYSSLQENAVLAKCALYDNDTVRLALSTFKSSGIAVIARIFCFEDNSVATAVPELAVKYMNTDVNWLDGSDENGGKSWLNPYSKSVRDYLTAVVREISNFGINAFMLEALHFPDGENVSAATYPGEKSESRRNAVLKNVISQINGAIGEKGMLIFAQSAVDAMDSANNIYYGSMSDISAYGVAVDTREKPLSVAVDKKTDYVSILSMYSTISLQYPGKKVIPLIDMQEYSYSYIRKMKKTGYDNFILYNEEGEY